MRVLASSLGSLAGMEVELSGWVHRIRDLGSLCFIMLRDRSGVVQVVVEGKSELTLESVIRVRGLVAENPKAPRGYGSPATPEGTGIEVRASSLEVLARAEPELPFPVNGDPEKVGLDIILDNRPIALRNPKLRAIFAVQSTIIRAFSEYLAGQDFTEVKTSKLIGTGTEGGTGLFEVEYFDTKVYLAQSPQFYKQTMVSSGFERVYEVAPAYRAEKHDTPRHLNEYVSLDLEMAFIDSELDLIKLEKGLLTHIFARVAERNAAELELWKATVPSAAAVAASPVIAHDEARDIASRECGKKLYDINPEAERVICDWALREKGSDLVFVNDFPRKARPFYAFPKEGSRTMSFDALFRGLEITTGGRRINEYDMLKESLAKFGLSETGMEDYTSIFRFGCPPHGGFAIGCERLTQKILGLSNVKEASLFPRDRKRVRP